MLPGLYFSGRIELSFRVPGKRERRTNNYNNYVDVAVIESGLIAKKMIWIM